VSKRKEVKEEVTTTQTTTVQTTTKKEEGNIVKVTLVPETWILAPLMTKEQLQRWREVGWVDDDALRLDRAFPRNSQGLPIIFKKWLRAPLIRACHELVRTEGIDFEKCRDIVNNFSIVDDNGVPLEYIVIPRPPLRYKRYVMPGKSEYFEYIDSTVHLTFNVITKDPKLFLKILSIAGRIGLMGKTRQGHGKFTIKVELKSG
jgi:hypothetical protein